MSKILELREKRAKSWEAAKAFLETKRGADDRLSEEDGAVFDKMEADVVSIGREIERLERAREIDTELTTATSKPIKNMPGASTAVPKSGRASDEYNAAFWNAMRDRTITNDLSVGIDSQGGYLAPEGFERTLVQSLADYNIMRQLARVIQTSFGDLRIPVAETTGTAAWVDESGEIPTGDGSFNQVTLSAHKLGTLVKVSHELLFDSAFPLESFIAQDFGRRMGTLEEEAFLVGDGSNKPTGVLNKAQIGVTAAKATDITFDEVMDLYHSLKTPYRNNAVFIANDMTVKTLRKLKDGNGQYLWQPSLVTGTPDTILGRPIHVSTYMPTIAASAKAMAFGDFSYYWIADRQGRVFQRLDEIFATTNQVGFKTVQRVDGNLILPEAVQVLQMAGA